MTAAADEESAGAAADDGQQASLPKADLDGQQAPARPGQRLSSLVVPMPTTAKRWPPEAERPAVGEVGYGRRRRSARRNGR